MADSTDTITYTQLFPARDTMWVLLLWAAVGSSVCSPIDKQNRVGSVLLDVVFAYTYALYNNHTYLGPVGMPTHVANFRQTWRSIRPPIEIHPRLPIGCRLMDRKVYRNETILREMWTSSAWRKALVRTQTNNACVVHLRRGDVHENGEKCGDYYRYTPTARFRWIIHKHCADLPVVIHSEHTRGVDWSWAKKHTVRLGHSIPDVWRDMIGARVLILSRSGFSMVPALFSKGLVVYQPFWHKPSPHMVLVGPDVALPHTQPFRVETTGCEGGMHGSSYPSTTSCRVPTRKTFSLIHHIPHAAQILFSCWSFFQATPGDDCAFEVPNGVQSPFMRWMVDAMGCQIVTRRSRCTRVGIYTGRLRVDAGESFSWMSSGAARRLTDRMLFPNESSTEIGFVQRKGKRRLLNTTLDPVFFESMSFYDQARFFHEHDIIIGAHGAAMTFSVFVRPCSVVVMVYPPHFYPIDFYEPLVEKAGGIAVSWWKGAYIGSNKTLLGDSRDRAIKDYVHHHADRSRYINTDVAIDQDRLVDEARRLRKQCLRS